MDYDFMDLFLTGMINHGSFIFGVALLIGATGIPVPGTLLVLVAGALARQGVLDIAPSIFFGFMGATAGDSISYYMGRLSKNWVGERLMHSQAWQYSQRLFDKLGGSVVYLTRFLLTPLAIPTNLFAGNSGYPYQSFLLYTAAGEMSWLLLYGGIGYYVGAQWAVIEQFVSDFTGLLLGIIVFVIGLYTIFKSTRNSTNSGG